VNLATESPEAVTGRSSIVLASLLTSLNALAEEEFETTLLERLEGEVAIRLYSTFGAVISKIELTTLEISVEFKDQC
jgi:hypothetical protein